MHWWDEQMLAPLFEVNERMLRLVPNVWVMAPAASLGAGLDDAAVRARLARCPFLLIDVGWMSLSAGSFQRLKGPRFLPATRQWHSPE